MEKSNQMIWVLYLMNWEKKIKIFLANLKNNSTIYT